MSTPIPSELKKKLIEKAQKGLTENELNQTVKGVVKLEQEHVKKRKVVNTPLVENANIVAVPKTQKDAVNYYI